MKIIKTTNNSRIIKDLGNFQDFGSVEFIAKQDLVNGSWITSKIIEIL